MRAIHLLLVVSGLVSKVATSSWTMTSVTSNPSFTGIASSDDGMKLAACTGTGPPFTAQGNLWTSTDAGASWIEDTSVGSVKNWKDITSSADGTKLVAVGRNGGQGGKIWTSTNSGTTWTEDTSVTTLDNDWWGVCSSADGTKVAAVARFENIWISTDSGASFAAVTNYQKGNGVPFSDITCSADFTKLVATDMGGCCGHGNIWISIDSGTTWNKVTPGGSTKRWYSVTSSADGTKVAAAVQYGSIWISTDSGASFTEDTSVGSTQSWNGITSSAEWENLAAVAEGGKIWTSTDSGTTWTEDTSVSSNKNWIGITSSVDGARMAAVLKGEVWTTSPPPSPSPPPPSPSPPPPSPSPPPVPPKGLHLADSDAQLHFGPNKECTIEFVPGPPPRLDSSCPILSPPSS